VKIEQWKIEDIIPYENNPRINDHAVDKTAMSIEQYGWQQPIVVDVNGIILVGHTRLKSAIKLGLNTCPVVTAHKLTAAQAKAYRLADNKTGELADWNQELLNVEIQELVDLDFDIELTGFDLEDFDILGEASGGNTEDDEVPEVPEEPVTKLGDLWICDGHRILCGDSTDAEQVKVLMDGEKADMVFCDPPYGMNLNTDYSGMSNELPGSGVKKSNKWNKIIGDDREFDIKEFDWIDCKEQFWCGADYYVDTLPNYGKNGAWFVWDKRTDENMDKMWGNNFETIWSLNKHKREVIRIKWSGIFGREKDDTKKTIHPTQKPTMLASFFIEKYGGVLVLDLFLGSGSTLIAAEKIGRRCFGCELDEKYTDVIIQRYVDYTGNRNLTRNGKEYIWEK